MDQQRGVKKPEPQKNWETVKQFTEKMEEWVRVKIDTECWEEYMHNEKLHIITISNILVT